MWKGGQAMVSMRSRCCVSGGQGATDCYRQGVKWITPAEDDQATTLVDGLTRPARRSFANKIHFPTVEPVLLRDLLHLKSVVFILVE